MDIREYTSPTLPVAQFVERYVDTDHYDAGCRGCDNYGQVWVCPPYDFSVSGYWSGFREVCLRGVQLRFSPDASCSKWAAFLSRWPKRPCAWLLRSFR